MARAASALSPAVRRISPQRVVVSAQTSSGAAKKMGLAPEAVKKDWVAGLLPGVQVVPSGVLGVARAQELGCVYCFAG